MCGAIGGAVVATVAQEQYAEVRGRSSRGSGLRLLCQSAGDAEDRTSRSARVSLRAMGVVLGVRFRTAMLVLTRTRWWVSPTLHRGFDPADA